MKQKNLSEVYSIIYVHFPLTYTYMRNVNLRKDIFSVHKSRILVFTIQEFCVQNSRAQSKN